MKSSEQIRFDGLYKRHVRALKLRGMSDSTIDVYSRAVRRLAAYGARTEGGLAVDSNRQGAQSKVLPRFKNGVFWVPLGEQIPTGSQCS